jgi:hypothetical protein
MLTADACASKAVSAEGKPLHGASKNSLNVARAIIYQIVLSYRKGVDERLATGAIQVAVQPDGEAP